MIWLCFVAGCSDFAFKHFDTTEPRARFNKVQPSTMGKSKPLVGILLGIQVVLPTDVDTTQAPAHTDDRNLKCLELLEFAIDREVFSVGESKS